MVYDPFAGIGTVLYRSIKLNRKSKGTELNTQYWKDGVTYCREEEHKKHQVPTLFDVSEFERKKAIA